MVAILHDHSRPPHSNLKAPRAVRCCIIPKQHNYGTAVELGHGTAQGHGYILAKGQSKEEQGMLEQLSGCIVRIW